MSITTCPLMSITTCPFTLKELKYVYLDINICQCFIGSSKRSKARKSSSIHKWINRERQFNSKTWNPWSLLAIQCERTRNSAC